MADRLTQLQEAVNQVLSMTMTSITLADYFCNSVGILQQTQDTDNEDNKDTSSSENNSTMLFANLITRTACDIDLLIDSLPSQEYTLDKQVETLKTLEMDNHNGAEKLGQVLGDAESMLVKVRDANKQVSDLVLSLDPTAAGVKTTDNETPSQ